MDFFLLICGNPLNNDQSVKIEIKDNKMKKKSNLISLGNEKSNE